MAEYESNLERGLADRKAGRVVPLSELKAMAESVEEAFEVLMGAGIGLAEAVADAPHSDVREATAEFQAAARAAMLAAAKEAISVMNERINVEDFRHGGQLAALDLRFDALPELCARIDALGTAAAAAAAAGAGKEEEG